jgi:hypothetical protein
MAATMAFITTLVVTQRETHTLDTYDYENFYNIGISWNWFLPK